MNKIIRFFKDSYSELRKVIWPSRDDVVSSTRVVIISTIIVAVVLGLIDILLLRGMAFLFKV